MSNASEQIRAIIYGRVSLDRQREGRSVDSQIIECQRWAGREDWRVVSVHRDDGISASRYARSKGRPGWQEVMDRITGGEADLLIVWEISRATRDRAVWAALLAACSERGVKIATGGRVHDPDDPDDAFMLDLQAALAVRESSKTRQRVLRGRMDAATEGRPHGKLAWAYRREYDPESRAFRRQVPHEERAPLVREMVRRVLAGEPCNRIAIDLNRRGVAAPRGGAWDLTQVRRVVTSPTNAGMRVHKGQLVKDADGEPLTAWEPIVSRADHHALAERFADTSRRTWRDGSIKHLLVNIARCGVCGARCRRIKNRGTPSYACGAGFCVARAQRHLDEFVTEVVLTRLERPDVLALLTPHDDGDARAAAEEARQLRARLEEFIDAAALGEVTPAALARIEGKLSPQIEAADRRARPRSLPTAVTDLIGAPRAGWELMGVPERREVTRALLVPHVFPVGKGCRTFDPDAIKIEWTVS